MEFYRTSAECQSINLPKCTDLDNVNFLIAASNVFICTEAARCYSSISNAPSHDCFTCLLQKQPSDTEPLWDEVGKFVTPKEGYLIADDTVLINLFGKDGFCSLSVEREASSNC